MLHIIRLKSQRLTIKKINFISIQNGTLGPFSSEHYLNTENSYFSHTHTDNLPRSRHKSLIEGNSSRVRVIVKAWLVYRPTLETFHVTTTTIFYEFLTSRMAFPSTKRSRVGLGTARDHTSLRTPAIFAYDIPRCIEIFGFFK